jgi:hypothetical protein
MLAFVSSCKAIGRSVPAFFVAMLMAPPTLAGTENLDYVIVGPHPACSIIAGEVHVRKFHVLLPASEIAAFASNKSIVSVDVCECALLGGDLQTCAIEGLSKKAQPVKMGPVERALLGGRIFIRVNDPDDFENLYAILHTLYPSQTLATTDIFDRILKEQIAVAPSSAGGIQPPQEPPSPPTITPSHEPQSGGRDDKEKKKRCEIEPSVCVSVSTGVPSVEFEVKCKVYPTVVFSTELKASLKAGPVTVSFSAEGEKKEEH